MIMSRSKVNKEAIKKGEVKMSDVGDAKERHCACPYCEQEVESIEAPFCQLCRVTLHRCAICYAVVGKEATICPRCGAELDHK